MNRCLLCRTSVAALMFATLLSSAGAQAPAPSSAPITAAKVYDVRDFFKKPERSRFSLAPDGRHLAFMARNNGRQNVFVQTLDAGGAPSGEARALTNESARDVSGFFWKGNAHVVYAKDFGGDENFHVLAVPIAGDSGAIKDLTPYDGVRAGIVDDLEDDDNHLLISHNKRDKKVFDVYRVDVRTGEAKLVAENPGNITGWITDHDGKLRVATTNDGVNTSVLYRDAESEPFKTIVTSNFRETLQPLFFTFDNKRLYVNSNRGRDKQAIFEFDPKIAKEDRLI